MYFKENENEIIHSGKAKIMGSGMNIVFGKCKDEVLEQLGSASKLF